MANSPIIIMQDSTSTAPLPPAGTSRHIPLARAGAGILCSAAWYAVTPVGYLERMKLVRFLSRMRGESVGVELKNGSVMQGTVSGIDGSMNTHLKRVSVTARGGNPSRLDTLSVRGNTVRYYVLPESLDVDALLKDEGKRARAERKDKRKARQGKKAARAADEAVAEAARARAAATRESGRGPRGRGGRGAAMGARPPSSSADKYQHGGGGRGRGYGGGGGRGYAARDGRGRGGGGPPRGARGRGRGG